MTLNRSSRMRMCNLNLSIAEFTTGMLDLHWDTHSKFYEAPVQMKAANGMFILDDFGRQKMSPREMLNRWIVPLERGTDFLSLHTGMKLEIPFDQINIFCTNLSPADLVLREHRI